MTLRVAPWTAWAARSTPWARDSTTARVSLLDADDQQVQALAKGLDGVQRKLAGEQAVRVAQDAERAAADVEQRRHLQEVETYARTQLTAVNTLGQGVEKLAEGDLISRLREDAFPARPAKMPSDFNAAVDNLQQTLAGILGAARSIRAGCGEISTAADDLAQRTERQAAAWSAPPPPSTRSPPR
jgi:methyl-accepting chemotaxis protein